MSVRKVSCPGCNATLNVPATMAHIKCSSCGTVWDVNNPSAAQKRPGSTKKGTKKKATDGDSSNSDASGGRKKKPQPALMIGIVSTLFAVLAIAGISVILFTGDDQPSETPSEQPVTEVTETTPSDYVVVKKLPESQRRNIYKDYRATASSSIEKKLMIPKDSVARTTVENTMGLLVDREVKHFALLNGITEEEVMQIVAEGDAKGWPPKKPAKKTAK